MAYRRGRRAPLRAYEAGWMLMLERFQFRGRDLLLTGDVSNVSVCNRFHWRHQDAMSLRPGRGRHTTSAIANPSYPFALTVCTIVALTRVSSFNRSLNRRTPLMFGSSLDASMTAPLRTTLSTTMTLPG